MIFSLIVIAITLGLAWTWAMRGFFSALLHMVCVVVAGAIALAVWEPAALLLLDKVPDKGFLSGLEGTAWAVGLLVPFAASLAVIRTAMDKAIPGNAEVDSLWNFTGGAVCGAVSGTLTAGLVAIGIGTMWFGTEFWGYKRMEWDATTMTMKRSGALLYPADDITAAFYSALSTSTLQPRANRSLAMLYPHLADVPATMRTTLSEGEGRNTIRPGQFELLSVYTVGLNAEGEPIQSITIRDLVTDPLNPVTPAPADRTGETIQGNGAYLAGFVTRFTSQAREPGIGMVTITPAQVRLVCAPRDGDGPAREFFPIATIARADPQVLKQQREQRQREQPTGLVPGLGQDAQDTNDVEYHRYLSDRSAMASVPSEGSPTMAFEFIVPGGYEPIAYYVKNVRVGVAGHVDQRYATPSQRYQAVESGAIAAGGRIEFTDADNVSTFQRSAERWREHGIELRNALPDRIVLHSTRVGALQVNDENRITGGQEIIARNRLAERGINRKLEVDQFAVTPDAYLVSIAVTPGRGQESPLALNLTTQPLTSAPLDQPIRLVDTQGNAYPCVGYIFQDPDTVHIRYTRSRPLRGFNDLPQVPSRPNPSIQITLLFEVTSGAVIEDFAVGNEIYRRLSPPIQER